MAVARRWRRWRPDIPVVGRIRFVFNPAHRHLGFDARLANNRIAGRIPLLSRFLAFCALRTALLGFGETGALLQTEKNAELYLQTAANFRYSEKPNTRFQDKQ